VALDPVAMKSLALELAAAMPPPQVMDFGLPPVDVSPRARAMRAIMRIADMHGWHSAITHFMESRGATYLSDLTDPQLFDLKDRMEGYVDAASIGASLADCLPAT